MLMMENFFDHKAAINKSNGFGVDDADAFGDFKFVPALSSLSNVHMPSSSASDDEWGDFVDCFSPNSVPNYKYSDHSPASDGASIALRPLPLSIFGEDEQESREEDPPDINTFSGVMNRQKEPPALAFSDLIANLYSQAEQIKGSSNDADVSDWKFKDASLDNRCVAHNPDSVRPNGLHIEDCELRFEDFVALYHRLKEIAQQHARRHLRVLEGEAKIADVSGDRAKAMTLHKEIQAGYTRLNEESKFSLDGPFGDHPLTKSDEELLKAVNAPKFQALEKEYCLSNKIILAKNSLSSTLELFEHTSSVLRIMALGTNEEKITYISAWSKIISTCCEELQCGALIWRKALENQVDRALLDDTRGMRYFVSLVEVYRTLVVLKVTCEVYKPWILLNSGASKEITVRLNECASVWNVSGLNEMLASISHSRHLGEKTKFLWGSIESIPKLDILSLQNSSSNSAHPLCRLSLLPLNCLHGVQSVLWNEQHFFLTLANLWANLISPECPQLPHLRSCRKVSQIL